MRLIRAIAWTGLGQLTLAVGGIVSAALVNRAIAPAGRGILAEAQTWAALFVTLLGISLASSIYHFANRERYAISDAGRLFVVLVTSAIVSLAATLGLAAVLFVPSGPVSPDTVSAWPVLIGFPAASIFCTNLQTLAVALGYARLSAAANLMMAFLSLAMLFTGYTAGILDVPYVLFVAIIVQAVGTFFVFMPLWRSVGIESAGIDAHLLRAFLFAGLKQHVGTISMFAYTRVNQLIVFHFWGDRETGLLAAAHALAFGCFTAFGAVQTALYAQISREKSDGLDLTVAMMRIALYSGLLLVIPATLAAEWLLQAYGGARFIEAAWSFRMLAPAAWVLSVAGMAAPYYVKAGAFTLASANSAIAAVIGIGLNLLLVPGFGANGAAAATLLTLALAFFGVIWMIRIMSGAWPWRAFVPDFRSERARLAAWWQSART
jgi:O-antigen/teichoic acid export membrane protein